MPFQARPRIKAHAHDWHMLTWTYSFDKNGEQIGYRANRFICLICDEIRLIGEKQ